MTFRSVFSRFFCLFLLLNSFCGIPQSQEISQEIFSEYEKFKEPALTTRRINQKDLLPLIEKLENLPGISVGKVGESIEGRPLKLISFGTGETSVFLWSQMHGDESTATMALFDIFNFLTSDDFRKEKEELLQNLSIHFLPMLNPDGAEDFQRRNALGIDINRDALRLQSPEGRTLKRVRDSLEADWGFNLHDQSKYYNAQGTAKPATISFLAPAYNFGKSVNEKRADAMRLTVKMNEQLQQHIPGQVARYNDDFEPRAFGDNIQKWGTRTILIESGGHYDDREKQEIRKLNFLAILTGLFSIAEDSYKEVDPRKYNEIPHNDSKLFDLKLSGLTYELLGEEYILDLGINQDEVFAANRQGFYLKGRVADQGDLSTHYGYEAIDVSGYTLIRGEIYPEVQENLSSVEELPFADLLEQGYGYVKVKNLPGTRTHTPFPLQVVSVNFKVPSELKLGNNPTFFLEKEGELKFAVINGFLHEIGESLESIENSVILR